MFGFRVSGSVILPVSIKSWISCLSRVQTFVSWPMVWWNLQYSFGLALGRGYCEGIGRNIPFSINFSRTLERGLPKVRESSRRLPDCVNPTASFRLLKRIILHCAGRLPYKIYLNIAAPTNRVSINRSCAKKLLLLCQIGLFLYPKPVQFLEISDS